MDDEVTPLLKLHDYFRGVSDHAIDEDMRVARVIQHAAGTTVHALNQPSQVVGFVLRGRLWQRNYFEHVIRDEKSLHRIREYIFNNPARWEFDRENTAAMKPEPDYVWRDGMSG